MYFRTMRKLYDRKAIQTSARPAWALSGRVSSFTKSFEQASSQQYRNGAAESKQTSVGHSSDSCGASRETLKGTSSAINVIPSGRRSLETEVAMRRKRREYKKTMALEPESTVVNLFCIRDSSANSTQRSWEVIDLAAQLVRLSSKRGRVASDLEVIDEKIAA
jgi:hypothetical protein